jgi:chemotaxis protein MotA
MEVVHPEQQQTNEGVLHMDFSTLVGLALGLLILGAALIMGHVPLNTLLNPEALLIVFGGTMTATMVSFHSQTLKCALLTLKGGSYESRLNTKDTVHYVMDVVAFVRDEGILALQPMIESIEIPFFRKGLQLLLDNRSERFIRDSLSTEIEVCYRESLDYARVYETAGGFAPTMGIIGAVIGLIHIVQSSQDPSILGKGVASAFSATLYGVAFSNLFLLPIAGKLRQRARDEWFILTLLLEAVLSLRSGEHPMIIEDRLNSFLSASSQQAITTGQRSGKHYASLPAVSDERLPAQSVMGDDFLQVGRLE